MAIQYISYVDKVVNGGVNDDGKWLNQDANEVKDVVNNNANELALKVGVGDNISQLVNDAGYITAAALPDLSSYVQAGDNITELVNNAGYITSAALANYVQVGDNVSQLNNDAGYITASDIPGTPNLQVVSNAGNQTNNAIKVTNANNIGTGSFGAIGYTTSISSAFLQAQQGGVDGSANLWLSQTFDNVPRLEFGNNLGGTRTIYATFTPGNDNNVALFAGTVRGFDPVNAQDFVTLTYFENNIGVSWSDITGSQSVIGNAGFSNTANYITLAEVPPQIQTDWDATTGLASILNKPNLATVATTGDYNDLINQPSIPDLSGYATETWVQSQGYLTSVPWSFDVNTGDLTIDGTTNNLDGRWLERSEGVITPGYGITVNGDLATGMGIELDTTVVDNRYLRKDVSDSNDSFSLTLGGLTSGDAVFTESVTLETVGIGTGDEVLLYGPGGVIQRKTLTVDGQFGIANASGTKQFDVALGTNLRIAGDGDTSISFNSSTNTVTITSIPGSGTGGVITSVFGRTTSAIVAETGDYNTSQVTESGNLYFTEARVRGTDLAGFTVGSNAAISATDTILGAFGKTQGQINARVPTSRTISISGTSGNITVSGTTTQNLGSNAAWTVNLATVGTAGTYTKVTTDAYGRVTSGTTLGTGDLPSSVFQNLSFDTTTSILSLSNSNATPIYSLRPITRQDALERYNQSVFTPFTTSAGHTGYVGGTEFGAGIRIERRSGDTSQTGWQIYKRANIDVLYYKTFDGSSTEGDWQTIASRSWVTSQIPTNYVTQVNSGIHLTGGPITSTGTLSVQFTANNYINDSQGNPRLYFGNTSNVNGIRVRLSDDSQNFYFANSGNTAVWTMNSSGELINGTVPWARLSDYPSVTAGNGMTGGGSLSSSVTVTMGTPSNITLSSTNSVTSGSHTHAFAPGGTTAQYIRGDGSLATFPPIPTVNNGTLTLATGTGLSGSATFTANQSGNSTFTVAAASGYGIPTTTQISNWNAAYGWGNHASAGYAVSGTGTSQVRTNSQLDARYLQIDKGRPTVDMDDLRTSGVYGGGANTSNRPPNTYSYSPFMVLQSGGDRFNQIWFNGYSGDDIILYRNGSSSTWGSWKTIADRDWVLNGVKNWTASHTWLPTIEPPVVAKQVAIGGATSGSFLKIVQNGSTENSVLLRGYAIDGKQLRLYEGGIQMPVGNAGQSGIYFGGNDATLRTNISGQTLISGYNGGAQAILFRPGGESVSAGQMAIDANGTITVDGLTGSGTQMVVANASGVLSRQAIPAAQTLSTSSNVAGRITISGGNSTDLYGLDRTSVSDDLNTGWTSTVGVGLWPFSNTTGSTGFPQTTGSGLYINRSGAANFQNAWILWKSGTTSDQTLKVNFGTGTSTWGGWKTLADRDWVTDQNYVTSTNFTWSNLSGKPSTFAPSAHTHAAADITSGTLAIARIPTGTTSSTVALGNHTHTFASLTSKPTTLSGYGITDAQSTITGGASTITSSNLTANRALISNGSGKVAVSAVTSTELGYLDGVTSAIQTQLNARVPTSRTVNGKALSANISLTASDVSAVPLSGNATISGTKTFSSPVVVPNATTSNHAVNLGQLNALVPQAASYGQYLLPWVVQGRREFIDPTTGTYYVGAILQSVNQTRFWANVLPNSFINDGDAVIIEGTLTVNRDVMVGNPTSILRIGDDITMPLPQPSSSLGAGYDVNYKLRVMMSKNVDVIYITVTMEAHAGNFDGGSFNYTETTFSSMGVPGSSNVLLRIGVNTTSGANVRLGGVSVVHHSGYSD